MAAELSPLRSTESFKNREWCIQLYHLDVERPVRKWLLCQISYAETTNQSSDNFFPPEDIRMGRTECAMNEQSLFTRWVVSLSVEAVSFP